MSRVAPTHGEQQMKSTVLALSLSVVFSLAAHDGPLVAGRDVTPPKRLLAPAPAYPTRAKQVGLQGLTVLAVTVGAEGQPTDIKVLRGVPLLDLAAVEAVRAWRYTPTLVENVAREVELVEVVDFFLSDNDKAQAYADLALDTRQPSGLRVFAISRFPQLPTKSQKVLAKALQRLLKDADQAVAKAADSARNELASEAK